MRGTRTRGAIGLGERNYKNGKLILFIRVDFFLWKVSILINLISFIFGRYVREEERERGVTY